MPVQAQPNWHFSRLTPAVGRRADGSAVIGPIKKSLSDRASNRIHRISPTSGAIA
jgi:hypothetical protein